jgi:hypothetical protein
VKYRTALASGFVLAVLFHLLFWYTLSNTAFFYLALPGLVTEDLVGVESIRVLLEVATNALLYSAILWALPKLFRRLQHPAT